MISTIIILIFIGVSIITIFKNKKILKGRNYRKN